MVLAAGSGTPSVMLAEIDSSVAVPVPLPFGEDGAFDCALARDGGVAVKVGYQVAAYRDGSLLDPVVLPSAWQIFPAVEPDAILMRLYPGRSQEPGEPSQVVVVDGSGAVRRSGAFPHDAGHGEVAGAVVGLTGIWSWSGQSRMPDAPVPASGVLSVFAALEPDGMYTADNKDVHAAIYPAAGLTRAPWPADLPEELRFDIAELLPEPLLTLPQSIPDADEATQAEWDTLLEMSTPRGPDHQMLGHPAFIQFGDSRPADRDGTPMTLLLQIDGDSIAGISFADGGRLHVWVTAANLKTGDLRSCQITMESC
jgi:Domain of unknown function (DUF1963)